MGAHVTARLLTEFELGVHQCRKCVTNCKSIRYSPVYSFGDPQGKPIIVVGINPSSAEYEGKNGGSPYLNDSNDVHMRSASQLQYFENHVYDFFETVQEFFDDSVKAEVVSWATSPWEKVGYLDVVKCVTKANNGQWSKVPPSEKKTIMENCQGYLVEQMLLYKPQLIVAYGKPACDWFEKYSTPPPRNYGSSTISIEDKSRIVSSAIAFVYQKQGGHFNPDEMGKIRGAIVSAFKSLLRERY